jgi:hypothetical protein
VCWFPGEGYNSFTDVEFHTVSNASTLHRDNVRLKQTAVLRRINSSVNSDIVCKKQTLGVGNCITYIINKHNEEHGSS